MIDGFRVIDGDSHMMEPMDIWENYLEEPFREKAPKVLGHRSKTALVYGPSEFFTPRPAQGSSTQTPVGRPQRPEHFEADFPERFGEAYESWWSLPSRLNHMDQEGIDATVGFATNGFMITSGAIADPRVQAAFCRAFNNWGADYCRDSAGRVKFVGMISLADIDGAVAEVERLADKPEVAAIVLPPVHSMIWSTEEFDPVWAALAAAEFAACFHGGGAQQTWFRSFSEGGLIPTSHALSNPVESMASLSTLIDGGVLERFPNLRVGFYEANAGWVPWWLARLDDHFEGRQARYSEGNHLSLLPSEYFARQGFVAADADEGPSRRWSTTSMATTWFSTATIPTPTARFPDRSKSSWTTTSPRTPSGRSCGITP